MRIQPGSTGAEDLLARVRSRYATAQAYSDHGTAVLTKWPEKGQRWSEIAYFRTEFIRGRAFRFRLFRESGDLHVGIWAAGNDVRVFLDGDVYREKTIEDALLSTRGVTSLSSWVVPQLLLGRSPCDGRAQHAGFEYVGCGRCSIIVIRDAVLGQQILSLGDDNSVRRFRDVFGAGGAGGIGGRDYSDNLLTYQSAFDREAEAQLPPDLDRAPW